jgi:hypothetical protein
MSSNILRRGVGLALALLLLAAPLALAQVATTSNIYGKVTDESGALLPGATVTLSGPTGTRSTTSGTDGEFRFVNVDHGRYRISVALTGFGGVNRDVVVSAGQNVTLDFSVKVATVEETVTVTAETPVVDTKKIGTSTAISKEELSQIPSSRDPWALMRTVPGVLVDRVNVAGSESGQQSGFVGKGSDPKDAVWSLDGVVITDMAAIGSSPSYFTFDTFDEVNFSTGGNDVKMATGGIGVGLVTKRGTNSFHGGIGANFTHDKLQSSNLPDELARDARLQGSDKADHTDQITDVSFDLGGPLLKDKLWFYGSVGKNDIRIRRLNQTADKTILENYAAKLNWQAGDSDMVSAFWFNGVKKKFGRAGANGALTYLDGTLWDQGGISPLKIPGLSKLEWNHIFSPSFFLNTKAAQYSNGFGLIPQGGLDAPFIIDNIRLEARGTSQESRNARPQRNFSTDATWFLSGAGGNHELRFGLGYRKVDANTDTIYPGSKVMIRLNPTSTRARFYRDTATRSTNKYHTAYLADTLTTGRFTLNLGLRFDRQTATDLPSSVEANPIIPNLLPAVDYEGGSGKVEWNDFSPRAGFTYALDASRKTVFRGSFARYAGQISSGDANWRNPLGTTLLEYDWIDRNGDNAVQANEADFANVRAAAGVDPNDPGALGESVYEIDPDYHANRDNEIVVGLDREIAANFAVSAAYTWRKSTDFTPTQLLSGYYWYSWIGVTSADYHAGAPVTQNGFTATPFILNDGVASRDNVTGGALLTNRPDFSRTFQGLELSLVKRMSNRWMGRVALSYNDWVENVGPGAMINPTHHDLDPQIDGGQSVSFSAGSGKNYYANAKWQVNANAMYQLPAGFEIAANLFGRQGYPKPVYLLLDTGALDGQLKVLADDIDAIRLKNLWNLDLRLAKNLRLGGANLILAGEVFNALNANTELYRNPQANATTFNRLDEILAPRIARISARLTF